MFFFIGFIFIKSIPFRQYFKLFFLFIRISIVCADYSCRISDNNRIIGNIFCYNASCTDNYLITDFDVRKNNAGGADKYIVTNVYSSNLAVSQNVFCGIVMSQKSTFTCKSSIDENEIVFSDKIAELDDIKSKVIEKYIYK